MSARRTAIVTGATGAIGRAIARGLAAHGFDLVLPVRDPGRAKGLPGRAEQVDVSSRASIEAFASRWSGPLSVLINNAAECPRRREQTPEGIERQLATNVLGYLWMTLAFQDALARSAPSRVTWSRATGPVGSTSAISSSPAGATTTTRPTASRSRPTA